jgi:hypothetical protein
MTKEGTDVCAWMALSDVSAFAGVWGKLLQECGETERYVVRVEYGHVSI